MFRLALSSLVVAALAAVLFLVPAWGKSAGLVGEDGPTHMGLYDIAYMLAVPGMVVTAPKNGTAICTNGTCDFTCNMGYLKCGATCVHSADEKPRPSLCRPCGNDAASRTWKSPVMSMSLASVSLL